MKLLDVPKNVLCKIINYTGGRGIDTKLRQLGIYPGRTLKILRYAPLGGPVMVEVDGRAVAIGRGIAAKIQVEKI